MRRFAGACRFVFNRALAFQNENHFSLTEAFICYLKTTQVMMFYFTRSLKAEKRTENQFCVMMHIL